ncbi:Spo0E family sporulation regulatory protein-aspartic acid phosphatase [Peribacillus sp. NPDC097895]|uniref:Spo0E family sporulation regulatory protein-aspartic acid phosphatase n=1 Tax=Peribacillus sp. NPDC097895 TaxID=3390619 RepID=UPI003D088CF3
MSSQEEYRQEMFKLAGKKGLSDPQIIKISQQLDGEIVMWQKIIQEIHPWQNKGLFHRLKSRFESISITHNRLIELNNIVL